MSEDDVVEEEEAEEDEEGLEPNPLSPKEDLLDAGFGEEEVV